MVAEYAQGDHLRLVKNTNYWRSGFPLLDEVSVSIHADAQAALVALESGALDLVSVGLPVTDMIRLQNDPAYPGAHQRSERHELGCLPELHAAADRQQTGAASFELRAGSAADGSRGLARTRKADRPTLVFGITRVRRQQERVVCIRPGQSQVAACSSRG